MVRRFAREQTAFFLLSRCHDEISNVSYPRFFLTPFFHIQWLAQETHTRGLRFGNARIMSGSLLVGVHHDAAHGILRFLGER